jgi:hypothetical protein
MSALDGVIPAIVGAANAAGGDLEILRSLRFNDDDSAYLSRTPSAGNRKTWTWSGWVKRTVSSTLDGLFFHDTGMYDFEYGGIIFNTDSTLAFNGYQTVFRRTAAVYRDPGAWMHVVVACDTTLSDADSRMRFYVNGTEITDWHTKNTITQNGDLSINQASEHRIGRVVGSYANQYLTEVQFVDGQQLAASDFGEYDDDNNWNPKAYSGSYGTNGFYLKFADNSSNAALGTDSSGNSNTWTVHNLNANGGEVTVANATDALPILNTTGDQGENVGSGTRSDSDGSSIVVAVPLNGSNGGTTITDYHQDIKGSGSAKTISIYTGTAGGATTSTAVSRYYGSSFYVVRGATNDYTASSYLYRTGDTDFDFGTGDFCVEFWYYPQSMVTNSVIFDNRHPTTNWPSSSNGFALIHNAGGSIFSYSGGNQIIAHASVLTAGKWHHIAYTRDQGTERLFVNGDFFTTTASSSRNYNEGRFHLGSAANNGEGSSGYYQDFRMYKGTPKYTSNFTAPTLGDGPAIDSLIDTPTNYTADSGNNGGNYCTLNPLDNESHTLSNGNLDITNFGSARQTHATILPSSGKWYAEFYFSAAPGDVQIGVANIKGTSYGGSDTNSWGVISINGNLIHNNSQSSYGSSFTTGDTIMVALDMDNGKWYAGKNGTWFNSGNPANGTNPAHTGLSGNIGFMVGSNSANGVVSCNFGDRSFSYTPPTDFLSLCTTNLADPTIAEGSTAMDALLYTGDGQSSKAVTGYGFSPGFLWIKERSSTSAHGLWNTVVGSSKYLSSNSTDAEVTTTTELNSIDSAGFTVGSSSMTNENSQTYVAWAWETGDTTTTVAKDANGTNLPGATCEYRANTTNGFSVVKVADPQSNEARVHGLGVAPDFFICKSTASADSWHCYWKILGRTKYINLNGTGGAVTSDQFGSQEPDSTYFYVKPNTGSGANKAGGMVYYLWSAVDQYSAFGEYVGNGSSDGPFVFTGFRPKWIVFKMHSGTGDWRLMDTSRDLSNPCDTQLYPNNTDADNSSTAHEVDYLSNGFKVVTSHSAMNSSGQSYLYAAFAEHPFKTARAR